MISIRIASVSMTKKNTVETCQRLPYAESLLLLALGWWNGRHVRLRGVCRKACGFKSRPEHFLVFIGEIAIESQSMTRVPDSFMTIDHTYEVRPRKDKRGFDLISDVLPFGRGSSVSRTPSSESSSMSRAS